MNTKFLTVGLLSIVCTVHAQQFFGNNNTTDPINRTGNIGIGTSSPGAKVSFSNVDETSNADGITWYNPGPTGYGIYRTPGSWTAPNYQQLKLQWHTGITLEPGSLYGKSYVEILGGGLRVTSGNVGVGTSMPESKFDVTNNYDGKIWNFQVSNEHHDLTGDQGVGMKFKLGADGEMDKWSGILGVSEGAWENYVGLSFYTQGSVPGTFNTEKMRISANGSVGIGTTVPESKLDVTHNYDGSSWNFQISNEHHDVTGDQAVGMKFKLGSEGELNKWSGILGVSEGAWENFVGLSFYTTGSAAGTQNTEKMRITSNGDVGIGTSSPDAKLTVKGDIHTREVKVDLNGAVTPDYVFEKDYDLLSLTELETYINQNKHLPEVPSAKEMEANGLNLKEMNLLLLKKVEELTLHLIEKDKKLITLEKRIEQLEAKK